MTPRELLALQKSAPQPKFLTVVFIYSCPSLLLTGTSGLLVAIPSFATWTNLNKAAYHSLFFAIQLGILTVATACLSRLYRQALWRPPNTVFHFNRYIPLAIAIPLLVFYSYRLPEYFQGISLILSVTDSGETLANLHRKVWEPLAYDSTFHGVVFSSLLSIVAPFFENILIVGILLNLLLRRFQLTTAVILNSAVFSLLHIPTFGVGFHLIHLFVAGLTYNLIRVTSGSLAASIAAHVLINLLIFVPKWVIAALYFSSLPNSSW